NWYYYDGGYNGNGAPTSLADLRTEFVYDGRTRLRKRVDYTATGGFPYSWAVSSETRYLYDGMRVIQERSSANTPTVSYTRGSDLTGSLEGAGGIGGLLARSHGYSSGNWSTHNFYQFMLNSPVMGHDPFGLKSQYADCMLGLLGGGDLVGECLKKSGCKTKDDCEKCMDWADKACKLYADSKKYDSCAGNDNCC